MPNQQVTTDSLDSKQLLKALTALRKGDFSVRLPEDLTGIDGRIADALNEVIEMNEKMVKEIERVSGVVGKEGKIAQRAALPSASGSWGTMVDAVNTLIDDMARPTSEM